MNNLRNQYIQAANRWRTREVQFLTQGKFPEFSKNLLDQLFSFRRLEDRELNPEDAERLMSARAWRQFPWAETLDLVGRFEAGKIPVTRSNFLNWLDQQEHTLTSPQADEVARALDQVRWKKLPACCRSNIGCYDCPSNLRWIRR